MKLFSVDLDIKSFFRRKLKKINDDFGIYLITGYQGSGKTYLAVYLTLKLSSDKVIYTNIKSLNIPNRKIKYFEKLEEITDNIEEDRIFIIDEISKKFTKECKQDRFFYSWLQQSRKRRRIVFLITQEYLQVPLWLRGIARFVFTTKKSPFLPIFITYKGIAVLNDNCEWEIQPLFRYVYKRNNYIASLYDTMEPVPVL